MKTRVCRLHGQNDLRIEEVPVVGPAAGEVLVAVGAGQCHKIPEGITIGEAACSEPLSVCVHARSRAGN